MQSFHLGSAFLQIPPRVEIELRFRAPVALWLQRFLFAFEPRAPRRGTHLVRLEVDGEIFDPPRDLLDRSWSPVAFLTPPEPRAVCAGGQILVCLQNLAGRTRRLRVEPIVAIDDEPEDVGELHAVQTHLRLRIRTPAHRRR